VVWIAADDASSAPSGSRCRPQAGAATDGDDGTDADLPAAADHGSASRAPDLPVSATRSRGRSAEPGLVCGYHLYSDAARLPLSGRGDGLGDAAGAELAFVEHHGCGVLRRCVGGSAGAVWPAGHLQQRSGEPVHLATIHGGADRRWCADLDGRPRPVDGQRVHRTAVA
jgi:hypothetical protein